MKTVSILCLLTLLSCPTYAGDTCSASEHLGTLTWVFDDDSATHMYTAPGLLNDVNGCLQDPFRCEQYPCNLFLLSDFECKEDPLPIGSCIRYLVVQCTENSKLQPATIGQLEIVDLQPCE